MAEVFDAVITGSGPNGLSAAIRLQELGLKTAIFEKASHPGGGTRTEELTLPGFKHDVCSAIHPMTIMSPFFKTLPLHEHGLEWVHPEIAFAHPFHDGSALAAWQDIHKTAFQLGEDQDRYLSLFEPLVDSWDDICTDILGPLGIPADPVKFTAFGLKAVLPARTLANLHFRKEKTKTFFYGAAAHSTLPLTSLFSGSFGLVLHILAHKAGWPFPKNGAYKISDALISYYKSVGGKLFPDFHIQNLQDLPKAKAYLFDLTPRQLIAIEGTDFPWLYRKRMGNFKYGAGVFKIDWALHNPVPFTNELCRKAGTIHLGNTTHTIEVSEREIHRNKTVNDPYVLMAQHSPFDPTRAPAGKHTAWAYCHVPNGNTKDMTTAIENQIEKVAPGFRDSIIAKSTFNTQQLEAFNPNLVGGDINGGLMDYTQLFTRPVARISPYSTPNPKVYICSSSTPPGGAVHGMAGYNAAQKVLKDHFPELSEKSPVL